MNLEDLTRRLQVLEDIEAIKKLKARYCQCADERDAEGFANLFTEDGVFEGGAFGRGQGRPGVAAFLRGVQQQSLPFALHYVMNPMIEVQGETATGKWYLFQPCTLAEGNQAAWLAARYEEEYVKVAGEWQFTHLKVFSSFMTPYEQGWAKKRFV